MRIRKLILSLFIIASSIASWASSLTATFYDDLSGTEDWTATYFALDKAQIAKALGCTENDLTSLGGSSIVIYSVKQDGSLVVPNGSYASANGHDGDWHDTKGYSLGGWSNTASFYHVVNYKDFSVGMGQNPKAGLAYGNTFRFRLIAKYTPTNGEAVSAPINITYKIYKEIEDSEVDATLNSALLLCKADIATTGRQVYYNKAEIETAIKAAEAATDISSKREAIKLLQQAHDNFWTITDAYEAMKKTVTSLYNNVAATDFNRKDEVEALYNQTLKYFDLDEDQTAWMQDKLDEVNSIVTAYNLSFKTESTIRSARLQLEETNYDGKEDLANAIKKANEDKLNATSAELYQAIIDAVSKAQEAYLANRPEEWITIKNGNAWTATNTGASVQAHGPGFIRVGDIWYMCGEDRTAAPSAPWTPDVNLYSSVDLVNWKFEKKIIENGVTTPELGHGRFIERPKLLYNPKTSKYLVWCHYEQGNYGASEAACFECDSVNGAYKKIWTGQPLNTKSRDCNVFQDNDGTAYFISTTDENSNLGLFRLSDDYHSAVEKTVLFAGQGREAPAIVRVGDRYFMFNSACSGWEPNQCKMSYTTNIKAGWTGLTNVGNYYAYDTQAAAILTIKGTKATTYLYVGDRWQDPGLAETKTIIFPVSFNGSSANLDCRERFDINFVTGEWRETPTEGVFADRTKFTIKAKSNEHASYPATAAIDGNVNTFWRTSSESDNDASAKYITIDMGSQQNIKGVVITPRLDYSKGLIRNCMIQTSTNGVTWFTVYKTNWLPYWAEVSFAEKKCRYVKITKTDGGVASIAEINVVLADNDVTGIEEITNPSNGSKEVSSAKYYTINGIEVTTPSKGMYIEKVTYSDGRTEAHAIRF